MWRSYLLVLLITTGCGRVADPSAPTRYKPVVAESLTCFQRGPQIVISFLKPPTTLLKHFKVARAELLRRNESPDAPRRLPEEEFLDQARIVASIGIEEIAAATNEIRLFDFPDLSATARLRYAVRYVKNDGTALPLSNYALIEPSIAIALPPEKVTATVTQESIILQWRPPAANIDSSTPANVAGYNVYRKTVKDERYPETPLNDKLILSNTFHDKKFKFDKEYCYIVRTASQTADGTVESDASQEVVIFAKDTFAPQHPSKITGAAASGVVSIFWPAVAGTDLKGYIVYRADSIDAPKSAWLRLTPEPITTTTFRDSSTIVGRTYYYYVTSIDFAGNESEPSEAVEVEAL
ncbi:MAG: hypothetical protein RMM17_02265 [Acidobacteriota bacterium]|nr:hypothetical protein [Blastocatellia bacterium]MDW8411494.1 hypothetical protein [Acidobacteriota bacterium]